MRTFIKPRFAFRVISYFVIKQAAVSNKKPVDSKPQQIASNKQGKPLTSQQRGTALVGWLLFVCCFACCLLPLAQAQEAPPDRATELRELLIKLHTTARLVQTTAHPDDEDGAMLTLESHGEGASVLLLTLTRGEGGQNKMGSNLLDVLGILRTLELLAADRYYGAEQRFTRVADFGFSKNPQETFLKWHGHEAALEDMVRVIRTFRPDVLVSRFQGTARDGHGQHSATGLLTREAFHAAADPRRFPQQIRAGLPPWQAKKLYMDNVRPPEVHTLALNTDTVDPLLGASYAQYARRGLKHQLSQGADAWQLPPGPHISYYRLMESVLPGPPPLSEQDFFEGIDTSLPGLASRLGREEAAVRFLRPALLDLQNQIQRATTAADSQPAAAAKPLLAGLKIVDDLVTKIETARLSPAGRSDLLVHLRTKQDQLRRAANLALGVDLQAMVAAPPAGSPESAFVAVPGQSFTLAVKLFNRGESSIAPLNIGLDLPAGWHASRVLPHDKSDLSGVAASSSFPPIKAGGETSVEFQVKVPANAEATRPYWRRSNPERDTIYAIDRPQFATLPFPPPPVYAHAEYEVEGERGSVIATGQVAYRDSTGELQQMPLAVEPAFSVTLQPVTRILPLATMNSFGLHVMVEKNLASAVRANLHLELPPGWRAESGTTPHAGPGNGQDQIQLEMKPELQRTEVDFRVIPGSVQLGQAEIKAIVDYSGVAYSGGYTVVARPDLGAFFYYQPASQRISVVDVKVPAGLKVGYIEGAGDEIPAVLRQVGMDVTVISPEQLATGNLQQFDSIVLGIRAYDTREDVRRYNARLLSYVAAGGTLLVQYNSGMADFNAGHFTPYPAELSRGRVTEVQAPIEMLAEGNPVFRFPNPITPADFQGWVQERGLYFMDTWDAHFQPLLASHDTGEPPLPGGLLYARYGKGIYVYTGYSFFRQLPAGVPGAIRLFVNLVSAGRDKTFSPQKAQRYTEEQGKRE
jgi:LmbE family N-acetylglucosaminyl deacetylase